MSKQISFGFGKSKTGSNTSTAQPAAQKPVSFSTKSRSTTNGGAARLPKPAKGALNDGDSENDDEQAPAHESVLGWSSGGVILGEPKEKQEERIIVNAGNGDWRRRGRKNLLPSEVQAQQEALQNGGGVVTIERSEISTTSGLQYAPLAETRVVEADDGTSNGTTTKPMPEKEMTEDERALAALLEDGSGKPKSNAVIATQGNIRLQQKDETTDFREDVATRPDSATLEEYAAMPVEEFGMAMLRGMGQKRKANGEVINFDRSKDDDKGSNKKPRKQEGFLGIGAKPAPGLQGVELGAWGKADMRKNNRGEGFFTPVMMQDKRTGERITEEEFERRKKEAKDPTRKKDSSGDDWRERRDRNLEKNGRNGETSGSKKRHRDDRERDYDNSKSGRDRERNTDRKRNQDRADNDYRSSRSRHDDDNGRDSNSSNRDRSKERRRRDDKHRDRDQERERERGMDRNRHRDGGKYDSSSLRKGEHGDRHRERERERERDRKSDNYH